MNRESAYADRESAYAELYADARKTAIETGRTPSQLAEDRRELLKALNMFLNEYANGAHGNDPEREARPEVKAARAAIAKATGTK